MQAPGIGRIVLFRTVDGDRPMLILKVWDENCVNGRVFLDGVNDRHLHFGMQTGDDIWVTSVSRGNFNYEWRFYDD